VRQRAAEPVERVYDEDVNPPFLNGVP